MKNFLARPSFLRTLYLAIFILLFFVIIFIPKLITGPLHVSERFILEEETIEGTLVGITFILSIFISRLYKRETERVKEIAEKLKNEKKYVEKRLCDCDRYIGAINVQIQEFSGIFDEIERYPETKSDFKEILHSFSDHILALINSAWVLIRIVNRNTHRTVSEHFQTRPGIADGYPHVSNKNFLSGDQDLPYTTVISNPQNLNIIVFCALPAEKITKDQRIFIQAIINEITKLFIILNSSFFQKSNASQESR